MGEDRLHVVFGTGQVGSALAAHLAGLGMAVRAVSRHRPPALAGGTDWHFRHESRVTSPPIWAQNLMLPPLWALAKLFGIHPYYDHWDSRT